MALGRVESSACNFLVSNCCTHSTYLRGRRPALIRLMKLGSRFRNANACRSFSRGGNTRPASSPQPAAYFLFKIVGAHPASSRVIEAEVLWTLERRVAALERQLREYEEATCAAPSLALRELKRQVDSFKNKFDNNDQLSWLSKYIPVISTRTLDNSYASRLAYIKESAVESVESVSSFFCGLYFLMRAFQDKI